SYAPLIWLYMDTMRGEALTRMWLVQSKEVLLDVRLWENPLYSDLMKGLQHLSQSTTRANCSTAEVVIQDVKDQSHWWRSLNLSFCTMARVNQTIEFLGGLHNTLDLESLNIGPMGSTALIVGKVFDEFNPSGHSLADPTAARALFQNLNVRPKVLRVDTSHEPFA
ncbi:hypothetical protein FRC08_004391, partial [Ceratobasidium sp. 394]